MVMMSCLCGMVEWQKDFGLICKWDHCHRSLPFRILDTVKAGFELVQNLSSAFVEWSCAALITTAPQHHNLCYGDLAYLWKVKSMTNLVPKILYFSALETLAFKFIYSLQRKSFSLTGAKTQNWYYQSISFAMSAY